MALIYYFVSHTTHIARLAEHSAAEMHGFAWLPITMTLWSVRGIQRPLPGHFFELAMSLVLLPTGALSVMYMRLKALGEVSSSTTLLLVGAAVWLSVFAWFALLAVNRIRELLDRTSTSESGNPTDHDSPA